METLLQDLSFAVRRIRKSPGFALAAVGTLALAMGANTAIFTLVNAVLLRPLPGVQASSELVNVHGSGDPGSGFDGFSYANYTDLRDRNPLVTLAAFNGRGFSLGHEGRTELIGGQLVSGNYFGVLGTIAQRGRLITPADDGVPGASPVVVIGHGLWQRRFGGDPEVLGRAVALNGFPFTVVGIAPEGFIGHFVGFPFDAWVPLAAAGQAAPGESLTARNSAWLELVGRLRPGVSLAQAQAGLATVAAVLQREHPVDNKGARIEVHPMTGIDTELRTPVIGFLALLEAAAAVVLLIACTNVASLLLARSAARSREMALRLAVGAGRARLVRQLLTETLLLFSLAAALGLVIARWAAELLVAFQPRSPIPLSFDLALDGRILAFSVLMTFGTALLFGLAPALQAARVDLVSALKDLPARGASRSRLRGLFVVAQVALSVVLLVGAGLFLRTLQQAKSVDPGFRAQGVHMARLDLTVLARTEAEGRRFFQAIQERLAASPGTTGVALTRRVPMGLGSLSTLVDVEGRPSPGGEGFKVDLNIVTPGYFDLLAVPLLAGRDFREQDRTGAPAVAVVNQALARRFWPGESALGKRIRRGSVAGIIDQLGMPGARTSRDVEIVGIAGDTRVRRLNEEPTPLLYLPFEQEYSPRMNVLLRGGGTAAQASATLAREVAALDPDLPLVNEMPLPEAVGVSLVPQRIAGSVAGALGALGLVLAAVGLYGVVAYFVSQRTREIGVRIALGAERADVLRLVLREGALLAGTGLLAGLLVTAGLTRFLRGMLFGISPTDPLTFAAIAVLMSVVALLASYIPARRATRVDPMVALRYE